MRAFLSVPSVSLAPASSSLPLLSLISPLVFPDLSRTILGSSPSDFGGWGVVTGPSSALFGVCQIWWGLLFSIFCLVLGTDSGSLPLKDADATFLLDVYSAMDLHL